mmetsp:Transcript_33797/g.78044  ORF Transcript_33797/g.78044 Transcript_33797/m.78044 type:complete len:216 (+) Transcript_33797:268-915(+)
MPRWADGRSVRRPWERRCTRLAYWTTTWSDKYAMRWTDLRSCRACSILPSSARRSTRERRTSSPGRKRLLGGGKWSAFGQTFEILKETTASTGTRPSSGAPRSNDLPKPSTTLRNGCSTRSIRMKMTIFPPPSSMPSHRRWRGAPSSTADRRTPSRRRCPSSSRPTTVGQTSRTTAIGTRRRRPHTSLAPISRPARPSSRPPLLSMSAPSASPLW